MIYPREEIRKVIVSKGFKLADGDHDYYWLYDGSKRTKWWIRLSRGSKYKDYNESLLKRQARILKVTLLDLRKLIDCTYKQYEFLEILRKNDAH